jgi:hypothetical protein
MILAESKIILGSMFFSFCSAIERVFGHSNGVLRRDDHGYTYRRHAEEKEKLKLCGAGRRCIR